MSDQSTPIWEQQASRREVIKKAAYLTPAILTLAAMPAFAAKGSGAPRARRKAHLYKIDKEKNDDER